MSGFPFFVEKEDVRLKDITPERFRCELGASCRTIYEYGDDELIIVGRAMGINDFMRIPGAKPVGPDERPIIISRELVKEALK